MPINHFMGGVIFAVAVIAVMVYIDPLISARMWCAITQSERCF